ncbi:MAG TPA: RbsD/FucU domain-containing protein [Fimbriimonadaceae bacterium]|nr:RbsD/FucU domain-containing protein [Fimbriimonadaceae bacterium]
MKRLALLALLLGAVCASTGVASQRKGTSIEALVASKLPALGHRNWIVVADSAYPLQTSPGIETIVVDASQLDTVRAVLAALAKTKHVRPTILIDEELAFVPEKHAPGIGRYRDSLAKLLRGKTVERLLHEQIIARLDEAGKTFKVLLIKTPHIQPYTSVFFQLECGYWSGEAESALREAMKTGGR